MKDKDKEKYLTSKEMMKTLKVSSCELIHLRVAGKLKYYKKGSAYFYKQTTKEKGKIKQKFKK